MINRAKAVFIWRIAVPQIEDFETVGNGPTDFVQEQQVAHRRFRSQAARAHLGDQMVPGSVDNTGLRPDSLSAAPQDSQAKGVDLQGHHEEPPMAPYRARQCRSVIFPGPLQGPQIEQDCLVSLHSLV